MGLLRLTSSGSNRVKWTTLTATLADVGDGAFTMAIGIKRATDDAIFHGLMYGLSSTGNGIVEQGLSLNGSDNLVIDDGGFPATTLAITRTTENYFIVLTKAAGSAAVNVSRYVKSTATWTHQNPGNRADQIDFTMIEIGAWQNADFFNGWVAVAAWWEGDMTLVNKEALVTNWRTSDLWSSAHGQPLFLVEGNVTGASLVDLAGNASGLTVTGTSLDAAESFASWNFDGTGVAAATSEVPVSVHRRAMRALVTR